MTSTQKTYSPIDGSLYVERSRATIEQIHTALKLSKESQENWKKISLHSGKRKSL